MASSSISTEEGSTEAALASAPVLSAAQRRKLRILANSPNRLKLITSGGSFPLVEEPFVEPPHSSTPQTSFHTSFSSALNTLSTSSSLSLSTDGGTFDPPFVLRHRPPVSSSSVESPAFEDPSISDGLLPEDSAPSSVTAEKLLRASITDRQFLYLRLACVALILPFYLGVDPLFLCVVSVLFHLTFLRSVFASLISVWISKRSIALQDLMGGWSDLVDITARVKGCYFNFCLWFVALALAGWALNPLSPLSPL